MDLLGLGNYSVYGKVDNVFDDNVIREHFENLCAKVGLECKQHLARAQAAIQTRDWVVVYSEFTSCRDAIVRPQGLLDGDERPWLLGCHALVSANLSAFHSINFGRALTDAIEASKARDEVQNVPEALDFKSYVERTLLKVMYLWSSTSDCEEEVLGADVKAFLIVALEHPKEDSDSEERTLKQQCKEFVINKSESVIWEVQKCFSKTEERLKWARQGREVYEKRYRGKLDYVSRGNEADTLFMSGPLEEASKVLAKISDKLDLEPWKGKFTEADPAAVYCTLQYAFFIHQMLCMCYTQMAVQSGADKYIELVNKEISLLTQLQVDNEIEFSYSRECLAKALEYAANNKWKEGYEKYFGMSGGQFGMSGGQSIWVRSAALVFLGECYTLFKTMYRESYESGLPDESHFLNAESLCAMMLLEPSFYSSFSISHSQSCTFVDLVRLYHEKDRQVLFFNQSSNMVDVDETAPILQYGKKAIECYVKALIQHTKHDDYWIEVQELYKDVYYMLQFRNFAVWIGNHGCTLDSTSDIPFQGRLQQLWNQSLRLEGVNAESAVLQKIWKQSLVWAERRLAKTIYFQLPPKMLSPSAIEQLGVFDLDDDEAWKTLKSSRASCGPSTVVLEYCVSEGNDLQCVYVMTKEDEVIMQILKLQGLENILRHSLEQLRKMFKKFSQGSTEDERKIMNGYLEWLYELFISPVQNVLDDMEEEDKLIIVAPEVWYTKSWCEILVCVDLLRLRS